MNITTNINDTTIDIIIETAGIAKTEAENILAGCNLASKNAQNCSNISQTLSLRMDEQVTIFTTRQNELNTAVHNVVEMCEQNLADMSDAEQTALTNIYNATANLDDTVTTGLFNIASAKNNALTSINSAIANLDDTVTNGLSDITEAETDALTSINTNKTSSISAITENKINALFEITTSRNDALSLISSAQDIAETSINTGIVNINQGLSNISDGIDDIEGVKTNALNNIETSETNALNNIAGARNQAIQDISDIAGVDFTAFALNSDLADIATSGDYNDLLNKPAIPVVPNNISAFTNDSGYLTQHQDISSKANSSDLAEVATSGDYDDLINKPTIPVVPANISAFTNDVGYLTQHQDISGKANSSSLATVAFTGNYNNLSNKPTIPTVPTNVSSFTNDAGYITEETVTGLIGDKEVITLASSGAAQLTDNSVHRVTATGVLVLIPPSISEKDKFHQMLVQLYMATAVTISLGTSKYFTGEEPDLSSAGHYNIIYEYNGSNWVVGAIFKGTK